MANDDTDNTQQESLSPELSRRVLVSLAASEKLDDATKSRLALARREAIQQEKRDSLFDRWVGVMQAWFSRGWIAPGGLVVASVLVAAVYLLQVAQSPESSPPVAQQGLGPELEIASSVETLSEIELAFELFSDDSHDLEFYESLALIEWWESEEV